MTISFDRPMIQPPPTAQRTAWWQPFGDYISGKRPALSDHSIVTASNSFVIVCGAVPDHTVTKAAITVPPIRMYPRRSVRCETKCGPSLPGILDGRMVTWRHPLWDTQSPKQASLVLRSLRAFE
jgi:hypothetical protein